MIHAFARLHLKLTQAVTHELGPAKPLFLICHAKVNLGGENFREKLDPHPRVCWVASVGELSLWPISGCC